MTIRPPMQRHDRLGTDERVGQELGGAVERRHAADRREPDRRQVPRGVGIGGRGVVEGQQREDECRHRDGRDDPEQRPPGVRLRLQAADRRAERHRAEDAHVHDHRGRAQLARRVADRQRRHCGDQQQARAEALEHVARDVHRGALRRGAEDRADHEQHRVGDHHPALRQVLGERHGEHRPDGVRRVGEAGAEAHRLQAHVQVPRDDRRERLQRGGQHQIRDQRAQHHPRDGGVATRERALEHQRPPLTTACLIGSWFSSAPLVLRLGGAGAPPA